MGGGVGGELVIRIGAPRRGGLWAEVVQPTMIWEHFAPCSLKAERRQSRLASKPSAFCWLSASGIAPVRVWLTMNVYPACHNVNTLIRRFSEIASCEPPEAGMTTRIALVSDLHANGAAIA
jgi:hypothetical protein